MKRFVEGADRARRRFCLSATRIGSTRTILFAVSTPFVDALDLTDLGFEGVEPAIATKTRRKNGRHSYPSRPA
jgi:hypothetical protein